MDAKWRRFAPLGLYLSLIALLASAGLYIVYREINLPLQISLVLIVVGLAAYAILDPGRTREALTGRQARYGSNALVLTIAFIGILVVVNYLVYTNSKRWDLTEDKQFTLAPETVDLLGKLKEPVTAQAFFTSRYPTDQAKGTLNQFQFQSKGKFTYKFINPETNPLAAEQAKISRDGSVVLSMGKNQQVVESATEQEITSALIRLVNPENRTVYFLVGHGEYDPEGSGDQAYSQVKRTLESKNYTVKNLNLLATNKIPDDAKAIIMAGPKKPVAQSEVDLLDAYLAKGGKAILMEEPLPFTDFGDSPDPLADYLANTWKIKLGKDIIVDVTSRQASLIAIGAQYETHPITQKLSGMATVFPTARSVSAEASSGDLTLTGLVSTSPQAWGETDLAAFKSDNPQVAPNKGVDLLGPVPMAATADNTKSKARLVVFGDADFASDKYFTAYGNADLFANSVDWAVGQENMINLTPKESKQRLMVPPQRVTMNLIFLGTVILLPGIVLFSGVAVWFQRRRRG